MDKPTSLSPRSYDERLTKPAAVARRLRFDSAHRPVPQPVLDYAGREARDTN